MEVLYQEKDWEFGNALEQTKLYVLTGSRLIIQAKMPKIDSFTLLLIIFQAGFLLIF